MHESFLATWEMLVCIGEKSVKDLHEDDIVGWKFGRDCWSTVVVRTLGAVEATRAKQALHQVWRIGESRQTD